MIDFKRRKLPLLLLVALLHLTGCSRTDKQNSSGSRARKESARVTFIELGSANCIPCMKMQIVMREIEREYGDQVAVIFHDVWTDAGRPYARQYGIRVIPTQVFLDRNGEEYFRHEGYFPKVELVQVLRQKGVK